MIVLDTHIWLWWINMDTARLDAGRRKTIETADRIGVSAISCFEIAWLERAGRLKLALPCQSWLEMASIASGVDLLPITPEVACRAVQLPAHHRDPHDRLIIATALSEKAQLMSFDSQFSAYQELAGMLLN